MWFATRREITMNRTKYATNEAVVCTKNYCPVVDPVRTCLHIYCAIGIAGAEHRQIGGTQARKLVNRMSGRKASLSLSSVLPPTDRQSGLPVAVRCATSVPTLIGTSIIDGYALPGVGGPLPGTGRSGWRTGRDARTRTVKPLGPADEFSSSLRLRQSLRLPAATHRRRSVLHWPRRRRCYRSIM